jgi:hypothetical protein
MGTGIELFAAVETAAQQRPTGRQWKWKPNSFSLGKGFIISFCDEGLKKLREEYGVNPHAIHMKRGSGSLYPATVIKGKSHAIHKLLKPAPTGAKYSYIDGNPLNLRLENIVVEMPQPKVEQKPRVKRVRRELPATPVTQELAGKWLTETFVDDKGRETSICEKMRRAIGSILRKDLLADEVHAQCYLSVLEQVAAGICASVNHRQFAAWCLVISRVQARKLLRGVTDGFIGDVEPDRAALKLKEVMKEVLASFSVQVDINGKQVLGKKIGRSKKREGSDHQFASHPEMKKQVGRMNRNARCWGSAKD